LVPAFLKNSRLEIADIRASLRWESAR
jgi:hypothetical protein